MLLIQGCQSQIANPTPSSSVPSASVTPIGPTPTALPTPTPFVFQGSLPLTVERYAPQPGEEVSMDAQLSWTFDQPVDAETVRQAIRFVPNLEGTWDLLEERTAVFSPSALTPGTRYAVSMSPEVMSEAGQDLTEGLDYTFSVLAPLQVTRTIPSAGSVDHRSDTPVILEFNYPMVPVTCVGPRDEVQDLCPTLPLSFTPSVMGSGHWAGTSRYVFESMKGFAAAQVYEVTLAGELSSVSGASLNGPYVWAFETVVPRIEHLTPSPGAKNVAIETAIRVGFNTPMDREVTAGELVVTDDTGEPVPGGITWLDGGAELVFEPLTRLRLGTPYQVRLGQRARAEGSAPLESGDGWAFQTVPLPALVSHSPAADARGTSVHGPTQLTFVGALDEASLRAGVHVTSTEGAHVVFGTYDETTGVYMASWERAPQTTYCLTVSAEVVDVYGNSLDNPTRFCFETGDLPPLAELSGVTGAVTLDTNRPAALRFMVRNVDQMTLRLSETDAVAFLRQESPSGAELRSWSATVSSVPNQVMPARIALQPQDGALPTGLYHLSWEVSGAQMPARSIPVAVIDRHLMVKLSDEEALVWVTDLASGVPISRTEVQILDQEGLLIAGGTTDLDGLVRLPLPPSEDGSLWRTLAAVTGQPGEPGFGIALTTWQGAASPWRFGIQADLGPRVAYQTYLITDRLLYRPGQKVAVAGLLREVVGGAYRLPQKGLTTTMQLRSETGQVVAQSAVPVGTSGWLSETVSLPDSLASGDYVLSLSAPAAQGGEMTHLGRVTLEVAPYRKPDYRVRVDADADAVLHSEDVTVSIEAVYYAGGAVPGAEVAWRVYAEPYSFRPESESTPGAASWSWQPPLHAYGRALVAEGTGFTDREGKLTVPLNAELVSFPGHDGFRSQRWSVDVRVTDVSGFPVSATGHFVVHSTDAYLGLRPTSNVVRPKERLALDLQMVDWNGTPVTGQAVELVLVKRTWYPADEATTWAYTDTVISEQEVETDIDGLAAAAFTAPRSGLYVVTADASEGMSFPATNDISFWVGGEEGNGWRSESSLLHLVADGDSYQVGDVAEILVPTDFAEGYQVLLAVERDGILSVARHEMDAPNPILTVPILESYIPNIYVSVAVIGPATETSPAFAAIGYLELPVDPVTCLLEVDVEAQDGPYEPGDSVELRIQTADSEGEPVSADVTVAVIDQAVVDLTASTRPSLETAFYGSRPLRVLTGDGLLISGDADTADLALGSDGVALGLGSATPPGRGGEAAAEAAAASIAARRDFADTAYWTTVLRTDDAGEAEVYFTLPDSLTSWDVRAWAATEETTVGEGHTILTVEKPLFVRPITPRFFVDGDRTELAAVVHNTTLESLVTHVALDAETGLTFESPARKEVTIGAGELRRLVWPVTVTQNPAGVVQMTVSAESGLYTDASGPTYGTSAIDGLPILDRTTPETVGFTGMVPPDGLSYEVVEIPPDADARTSLTIQVAPNYASLLSAAVADRPPCGEDVGRCAGDLLSASAALAALGRGPDGEQTAVDENAAAADSAQRPYTDGDGSDVAAALRQLTDRQNPDGGWGWWRDRSNLHLTSYVVFALQRAASAGIEVPPEVIEASLAYVSDTVARGIAKDLRYPYFALALRVLSAGGQPWPQGAGSALYAYRQALGLEGRAHLAVAYGLVDPSDTRIVTLMDEVRAAAVIRGSSLHWEEIDPEQWTTSVQLTAAVVDALAILDPAAPEIGPAVTWLLQTRIGMDWRTAYERAWSLVAVADYVAFAPALAPALDDAAGRIEIAINGQPVRLTPMVSERGYQAMMAVVYLDGDGSAQVLQRGRNVIEIAYAGGGEGALTYAGQLEILVHDDGEKAGESRGLTLTRRYCVQSVGLDMASRDPERACQTAERVEVGQLVDVHLNLTAPETRFYVELRDPLPAGFEVVDSKMALQGNTQVGFGVGQGGASGDAAPEADPAHSPFLPFGAGDQAVSFLAEALPPGSYEIVYTLRAVIPGSYRALPAVAEERYFPEVHGRSAVDRLWVEASLAD